LLISDCRTGYNLSGGKVGGCDSVCDFDINALELIEKVEMYGEVSPTRSELLELVMLANGQNGCHTVSWQEKAKVAIAKALGQ